jgi:RNA polymerase sigma-70 factor, ECF subfamily
MRAAAERELVARLRAGEPRAFEELDRRYRRPLQAFAARRLGDRAEAEDVAQEVMLDAYRGLHGYLGTAPLATWLFGIAYHKTSKHIGHLARWPLPIAQERLPDLPAPAVTPDDRLDAARVLARCRAALAERVSEPQRRLFELRYGENRSVRSIAERLGATPAAVKVGLLRTRRTLARCTQGLDQVLG